MNIYCKSAGWSCNKHSSIHWSWTSSTLQIHRDGVKHKSSTQAQRKMIVIPSISGSYSFR